MYVSMFHVDSNFLLKMWGASAWAQCGYSFGGASLTFSSLHTYHLSND